MVPALVVGSVAPLLPIVNPGHVLQWRGLLTRQMKSLGTLPSRLASTMSNQMRPSWRHGNLQFGSAKNIVKGPAQSL
jgi:hypothetical protein